jgi:hypothetical protein
MDLIKFIIKVYGIEKHLHYIEKLLKENIMQSQELFDAVVALAPQVAKIQAEVTDLNNKFIACSTGSVPDEVAAAIAAVQSSVSALDALVPDLPVV